MTSMKYARWMFIAAVLSSPFWHAERAHSAVAESAATTKSANVSVPGNQKWFDTGMDVNAGDKLHITAKGTVTMGQNAAITPAGAPRGWVDTLRPLMVPSAGRGALVGRIGNSDAATPFVVGADGSVTAPVAGRLYLGINQDVTQAPDGKYEVHIDRVVATSAAGSQAKYNFQPLFAELNQKLPYRISDKPENGNPGDLVNFVLVGTQEQVTKAFKSAGWLQADKTNKDAVVSALLATLQKDPYMTVPMSILYLFGRPQDFGFERTDPVLVAAQRHHFRIWDAPFSTPQQMLWAGAGTHDIGIEKDQRSANAITHKIDQEVDKERDFIAATLQQAGWVQAMEYMTRPNPLTETKTATGGTIKSDGRVLVIVLNKTQQ
ncbi:MAG: LssY C-terminal domain-containing protein [Acidobacteriota bacterium]|nr:LssY C-terminal domain-containing protein [Acidobacteriota bacterium]